MKSKTRPNDYLVPAAHDRGIIIGDLRHQPDGRYKATHVELGALGVYPDLRTAFIAVRSAASS